MQSKYVQVMITEKCKVIHTQYLSTIIGKYYGQKEKKLTQGPEQ